MNWEDVQKKHMRQWGEFEQERDKSWQQLKKQHDEIRGAFKDDADLPPSMKDKFKTDLETWQKEWGSDSEKMKQLKAIQSQEMNSLQVNPGRYVNESNQEPLQKQPQGVVMEEKNETPLALTDREKLKQKFKEQMLMIGRSKDQGLEH